MIFLAQSTAKDHLRANQKSSNHEKNSLMVLDAARPTANTTKANSKHNQGMIVTNIS